MQICSQALNSFYRINCTTNFSIISKFRYLLLTESSTSLTHITNRIGPKTELWGTPLNTRDYINKAISRYRSLATHRYSLQYRGTEHAYDIAQTPPDFILMEHAVSDYRKKPPYTHRASSPCNVIPVINDWLTGRRRSSAHPSLPTMPSPSLSCGSRNYPSSFSLLPRPLSLPLAFPLGLRVTWYCDTNCYDNRYGFSATI